MSGGSAAILERTDDYCTIRLDSGRFTGSWREDPDGTSLVVFRKEKVVLLREGTRMYVHVAAGWDVRSAALADDGRVVLGATGAAETGLVRMLDPGGRMLLEERLTAPVVGVALAPDSRTLFAATAPPEDRIFAMDVTTRKRRWERTNPADEEVAALELDRKDGSLLVMVGPPGLTVLAHRLDPRDGAARAGS